MWQFLFITEISDAGGDNQQLKSLGDAELRHRVAKLNPSKHGQSARCPAKKNNLSW